MSDLFTTVTGSGAAWMALPERGLLRVEGKDRVRFLNGMVTNDVSALASGDLCHAAMLDRKGRVQAELWVLALEGAFVLDTSPGTGARVAASLERHVIADDVRIEDRSAACSQVAFEGPDARTILLDRGVPLPDPDRGVEALRGGHALLWLGRGHLGAEGIRVVGPSAGLTALVQEVALPEISPEQAEILRVERFLPRYGVDVTDRNFPQEARLEDAVSMTKGCYIGQEIVARIQSRGRVNRLLVKIRTERAAGRGDPIVAEGKEVGQVTSAVISPLGGPVALGYVQADLARPGTPLSVREAFAVVLGPPFDSTAPVGSTRS